MTIETKIEEAQARLLELEAEIGQAFSRARWCLTQAADEHRRLRHEAANANLRIYTEAEAAAFFGIGESTLRRLRTSAPGAWPFSRAGDRIFYTNFHLVEIAELLDARQAVRERKKKGSHLRDAHAA